MSSRSRWKPTPALLGSLLLCLAAGSLTTPPSAAAERPDLSGRWEMDRELSEDPMEKLLEFEQGYGPGRGGRQDRFGDGFRSSGGPGRRHGGLAPSVEEMKPRLEEMRAGIERLSIAQAGTTVTIAFADGREQAMPADNKWRTFATAFGEAKIRARWRDGALQVRRRGERGEATETWFVTGDKGLLTVLVEMAVPGPRGSVSFKRVYRPYDPAGGA